MIDVIILNRNLPEVCDELRENLLRLGVREEAIDVVDSGSRATGRSRHTTVEAVDPITREQGLRYGRGMNLGLRQRAKRASRNDWVLLLPVDTEIVTYDLEGLMTDLEGLPGMVAVRPLEAESGYATILPAESTKLAWNVDEGPWLVNDQFITAQTAMSSSGDFFDPDNFRGYLMALELAYRAYVNGYCVGVTSRIVVRENETHLLEKASLIQTEPMDENLRLLVQEGRLWLRSRYRIDDPWSFAQLVRLVYSQFLEERPEYDGWTITSLTGGK